MIRRPPRSTLFPTRRSSDLERHAPSGAPHVLERIVEEQEVGARQLAPECRAGAERSEEHTSELQSRLHLVCRLLLEQTNKHADPPGTSPRSPPRVRPLRGIQ